MTVNNKKTEQRLRALDKRIAKLEKSAVLFEEHRQAWIVLNKGCKQMLQEMKRDQRKELAREKRLAKLVKKSVTAPDPLAALRSFGADRRSR